MQGNLAAIGTGDQCIIKAGEARCLPKKECDGPLLFSSRGLVNRGVALLLQ